MERGTPKLALFDELLERDERDLEEDGEERDEERSEEDDEEDEESESRSRRSAQSEEDDELDGDWDPERARRTIKNLRNREKELDRRTKELERENKKFKRSNQSRDQQLQDDLSERDEKITELQTTNETLVRENRRYSFMERMQAAGFTAKQARYAFKDLDEIGVEAEFDENNRLTNPKAIRKAAKEYDSEMYATGSADGGRRERTTGGAGESSGGMNDLIRGAAGR